jgi:hypothetical protein
VRTDKAGFGHLLSHLIFHIHRKTKMKTKKPIIKIIIESSERQTRARDEIGSKVLEVCDKFKLCYYEIFGILEAIKMDLQDDVSNIE